MATIEQVEQLRKRAHVSYQDAKEALEACNDDILEALIYLEKQGKVQPPKEGGHFSTQRNTPPPPPPREIPLDRENIHSLLRRFVEWVGKWIRKGNRNYFVVLRKKERLFSLPLTIFIIALILLFEPFLVFLVFGLLIGFRYQFQGPDIRDHSSYSTSSKEDFHD